MAATKDSDLARAVPSCPVCDSRQAVQIHSNCTMGTPHAIAGAIVRCQDCGMWYKVVDDPQAFAKAYGPAYAEVSGSGDYMNSEIAQAFMRSVLQKAVVASDGRTPKLLDIGCATGTLLEQARSLGYVAEGVELCDGLAEIARQKGFQVYQGDAADLSETEKYDVVTAMDLIEHLPDPRRLLAAAHRALKPGGELIVYTPNHRSAIVVLAKILRRLGAPFAFDNIFGTNHVCFFDDRTLSTALQRSGFQVRRIWRFPYDPRRPGMKVSLLNLAVVRAVEELGRPFGAIFRMVAYARKR